MQAQVDAAREAAAQAAARATRLESELQGARAEVTGRRHPDCGQW